MINNKERRKKTKEGRQEHRKKRGKEGRKEGRKKERIDIEKGSR